MKPLILLTMGDPAGIGPEIVVKALADPQTAEVARCVAVGDAGVLERAMAFPGMPSLRLRAVGEPGAGEFEPGVLNLVDLANIAPASFRPGRVDASCGRAAYEYVERACSLTLAGKADAVATAPLNKEALHAARVPYIGHTEIFAGLTGTPDPLTLFEVKGLRVFFLTRHVSLRQACDLVTEERLCDYIRRCTAALRKLGVADGVMAVAGLNPHNGEHGLFGDEEERIIRPAVEKMRAAGFPVAGPVPPDSVFSQALHGRYNSVLSLYHDQGHIATKTLDFERTISVTAGMPILRTSVDHGTGFDIAGQGVASSVSMVEAVKVAARYAPFYR